MKAELDGERTQARNRLRRAALKERDALSFEERRRASVLMTERLLGHQWFYGSDIFLCFVSYGSEIGTHELIREAIRLGKRVYVPKVTHMSEKQEMIFRRLTDMSELAEGYRGIPEPPEKAERYIYDAEEAGRTLLLMPGAAFDRYRNRLGYGKGFYDAFLADKEDLRLRSIAVGFACQTVDEIPVRAGDVRPYQVLCF